MFVLYDVTSCLCGRPESPGPAHPASLGSRAPHTARHVFLWAWEERKSMITRLRATPWEYEDFGLVLSPFPSLLSKLPLLSHVGFPQDVPEPSG